MKVRSDYFERVYAGVLGKIIGVYLGSPFEGWSYERIMQQLGEIEYFVNERRGKALVAPDDDISGTFTFIRAMADNAVPREVASELIGNTWLNYIIEERTILWWGGIGNSTEHTAFLRLKHGIHAPLSGSTSANGKIISEQIGAQIFIDGWGMMSPGDPELAADLARRAASVSHDGEAIYGAQVVAAMEALAFVEPDIDTLLDTAVSLIPGDSLIFRLIADLRTWHETYADWRTARAQIEANYGYDKYRGGCHIIPNHALVILALLYGNGGFSESLKIVNTSGWDTDCNSGNVGCLLGIRNGLEGIDAGPNWRSPVADRLYISSAEGGRSITDAVQEALAISNVGRRLAGLPDFVPKNGARFNFDLPGSVQGFRTESDRLSLANVRGHSDTGACTLALRYRPLEQGAYARALTTTFIPPEDAETRYELIASPTLYSGQIVHARLKADDQNLGPLDVQLSIAFYQREDVIATLESTARTLTPGDAAVIEWKIPDTESFPIVKVGVCVSNSHEHGTVYLDWLTWGGSPEVTFRCLETLHRSSTRRPMWLRAWTEGVDQFEPWRSQSFDLIQNEGRGLISQGTRDWKDYVVSAVVRVYLAEAFGLCVRAQGLRRHYALIVSADRTARLVKSMNGETVLAEAEFALEWNRTYRLELEVVGTTLRGRVDGVELFAVEDRERPIEGGAVALICDTGRIGAEAVSVMPVPAGRPVLSDRLVPAGRRI